MPAPLIWINAFPGTGKLTIAKAMAVLDPSIVVIDNHQLIDPVAAKFARDHPDYQAERKLERERAFQRYVMDPALASSTIVFTDYQSTDDLGTAVAEEYPIAAREAGRPFIPVSLSCEDEVILARAASHERLHGGTTKLTQADVLRSILSVTKLYTFEASSYPRLHIDNTHMAADDAAKAILKHRESIEHAV